MSCYNFNTGMPDYRGRDGSMDMSGWQNWQRNMDNSGMSDSRMNSGMNDNRMSGGMNNSMNNSNMNSNMGMQMPGWMDRYSEQNPASSIPQGNGFCPDSGEFPLAMSYVPMQRWTQPLPIDRAMTRGTIFQELDLPFMMGRCR